MTYLSQETERSNFLEIFKQEATERMHLKPDSLCKYGIRALDDALVCIRNNDLIVLGAYSGSGKSEIALHIAKYNAERGKKVKLFYLEGGHTEAMQRLKWKDIIQEYYKSYSGAGLNMDYTRWVSNLLSDPEHILLKIEKNIYKKYKETYADNLWICPITAEFTVDDLLGNLINFHTLVEKEGEFMLQSHFDIDLIVIDHLQYFSLTGKESEIQQTTSIIRECKKIADMYKIPVVLISHLRKKVKDKGLPDQDDFYGSSNIPKISSTSIIITPDFENDNISDNIYPTIFRIAKSRTGVRQNLAIKVLFDLDTRQYSDNYEIFKINSMNAIGKEPLEGKEKPKWAR